MIADEYLLGGTPLHTFEDYIKHNELVVGKIYIDEEAIHLIVNHYLIY
jgi:starvation-inducible DNA-binding protein